MNLQARQATWAEVRLDLVLPYSQQHLKTSLNGELLNHLTSPHPYTHFTIALPLNLHAGNNRFELLTDRSNLDPVGQPFAPLDRSDMAVSLTQVEFTPLKVFTQQQIGQLYGAVQLPQPNSYLTVSGPALTLFVRFPKPQLLNYRLLSNADRQTFDFQLNGHSIRSVSAGPRGSLVQGQLPLHLDGTLQQVRIVARDAVLTATTPHSTARDTVQLLEQVAGPFSFAVQELGFTRSHPHQTWAGPLAAVGAVLALLLVALLLFGRRRGGATS